MEYNERNNAIHAGANAAPLAPRTVEPGTYRPSLALYHPNAKGTGCAVKFALHPAHDDTDGSIMMTLANQLTVGDNRGSTRVFPRFDWENRIVVKLDFADLSRMLQVFRGECETLEEGRGLYHATPDFTTKIVLRHILEPVAGYSLEVYRNARTGGEERRAHILLAPYEALGLGEAITGAMAVVSFGIPMLVKHDTSAYQAKARGARDVAAA